MAPVTGPGGRDPRLSDRPSRSPTSQVVRIRTPKPEELQAALAGAGAETTVVAPDRVEVTGATPERIGLLAADHAIPIFETSTETFNLEDVFFQLTARADNGDAL
jgi:ABC-2 type transport system ATP-binding protein